MALGASRWQLVRGILLESLLVVGAGSVLGVGVDMTALPAFVRAAQGAIPRIQAVTVDVPVMAFCLVVVFVVTLLSGLAAVLKISGKDVAQSLGDVRSTPTPTGRRLMSGLVVAQLVLSIVLLTGAGLFARTVASLLNEDPGFDPTRALTARLALDDITPPSPAERALFVRRVVSRVRSLPAVLQSGIGSLLPPIESPISIYVSRISESSREFQRMSLGWVTPGYFEALGGRLLRGRLFEELDVDEPVVLLSKSAARFLSPENDPVGRELSIRLPPITGLSGPPRVIGIVDDIKFTGLDAPSDATVYVPTASPKAGHLYLIVRTEEDLSALAPALRRILQEVDPGLPQPPFASLQDVMEASILERRMRLIAAGGFAALALAIALVGLFAQIGREVAERRHEFAIRLAFGASPRRIVRMLAVRVASLVSISVVLGLMLVAFAGRGIEALLYGVSSFSPETFCVAVAIVSVAAFCASYVPVRRAACLEPFKWLRVG
jgi:putative ABC transport system permease protein